MNPIAMTVLLLVAWGIFAWQMMRRYRLMSIGPGENRFDNIGERLRRTWEYAFVQKRMPRYKWAGYAHKLIFLGFVVLLLRTLILWGRGYREDFNFWIFGTDQPPGFVYSILKDVFAILVLLGTAVFFYYRLVVRPPRMSRGFEGILILLIIATMMIADIVYDGASLVREHHAAGTPLRFHAAEPAGSILALPLAGLSDGALNFLRHAGFWTHGALVLLFLNLLPISKHFHVITGIPNVFFQSLAPRGRLPNVTDIEGRIEREETLGLARINQMSWKGVLDLYTCTECGRCSDHCPATKTGKKLSPKHFTLDLRDYLYKHEKELTGKGTEGNGWKPEDIVPSVVDPEVIWACTSCGACETECPVFITYVDKIVDVRRHLVMEKSEFPAELQNAFRGIESNSNPWNFPASDRAAWAADLDVPRMSEKPDADVLFWVGCSASFDDRAKRIARATAQLLKAANVNFAILAEEEQCTGDPARRAGNEFLYQILAQANVEILNNYKPKTILTSCPHCFNTILNEYPEFGGRFNVVHHSQFLGSLIKDGRLKPRKSIDARVAYHDSCYMGRYNEVYEPPRETLRSIPGLTVLEPAQTRDRGMCCGAGGAQMFKEEEHGSERVNALRTDQLLETRPDMVASNCPFCQRMLIDGLATRQREDVKQYDIAELLWQSVEASNDQ